MKIFDVQERRKGRHKFGGTKLCKAEEVRNYFVNPKIEIGSFQLHYLQFRFQKYLMYSPFIAYENEEWCRYVVRIGSLLLTSFYCVCFVSFYFFLFVLVFL